MSAQYKTFRKKNHTKILKYGHKNSRKNKYRGGARKSVFWSALSLFKKNKVDSTKPTIVHEVPPNPVFASKPEPPVFASKPEPPVLASDTEPPVLAYDPESPVLASDPEPPVLASDKNPRLNKIYIINGNGSIIAQANRFLTINIPKNVEIFTYTGFREDFVSDKSNVLLCHNLAEVTEPDTAENIRYIQTPIYKYKHKPGEKNIFPEMYLRLNEAELSDRISGILHCKRDEEHGQLLEIIHKYGIILLSEAIELIQEHYENINASNGTIKIYLGTPLIIEDFYASDLHRNQSKMKFIANLTDFNSSLDFDSIYVDQKETTNHVLLLNNVQFVLTTKKFRVSKYSNQADYIEDSTFYTEMMIEAILRINRYLITIDKTPNIFPQFIYINLTHSTQETTEDAIYEHLLNEIIKANTYTRWLYRYKHASLRVYILHDTIFEEFDTVKKAFLDMFSKAFTYAMDNVDNADKFTFDAEHKTLLSGIKDKLASYLENTKSDEYDGVVDILCDVLIENIRKIVEEKELASREEQAHVVDSQRMWLSQQESNSDEIPKLIPKLIDVQPIRNKKTTLKDRMRAKLKSIFQRRNQTYPSSFSAIGGIKTTHKRRRITKRA